MKARTAHTKLNPAAIAAAYHYAHNHLSSPVALMGWEGETPAFQILERYEYDAYGTVHIMDSGYTSRSETAYGNPYTFTGRRLDTFDWDNTAEAWQLTLMHYRHRTYDPYTGRFMQQDPLGYVDGMSLYEYVVSNPILLLDPMGLRKVKIIFGYQYKTSSLKQYVPEINKIEEEVKAILKPCFTQLKCDTVEIKCRVHEKAPLVTGLHKGERSGKPIYYIQHIIFSGNMGSKAASNLAYTKGSESTIYVKRIDRAILETVDPKELKERKQNKHVIFANITVHEAIWLGMLGKSDDRTAEGGSLSSHKAKHTRMEITENECEKIRNKLKVE